MTGRMHRRTGTLMVFLAFALVTVGAGASPRAAPSSVSADAARLSIPRPTGGHPVGVRSTFVHDPARTEPASGTQRAIPVRVWYPAKRRHGRPAPYLSAPVQGFIERALGLPAGLFDVDTHATVDARPDRHVRGVLLMTGGFAVPVALYTGLVAELASRGYVVVAFEHPHETFVVEQPGGSLIPNDLPDDAAVFEARMLDIGLVLNALDHLVPELRPRTPIGIFGHSNGGAAAGVAMRRHPQIHAGVNLDGFIPADLITAGLDRPYGLMLGVDAQPEQLRELEVFLSNMRAPHPVWRFDVRHFGFTDFVVFNPQAQRDDPAIGTAFEAMFPTGTVDSVGAGRRALGRQRELLVRFFDRYLPDRRAGGADHGRR